LSRCASRCTASGTSQAGVQTRIRIEPHQNRPVAERLSGGLGLVAEEKARRHLTSATAMRRNQRSTATRKSPWP
jgi:hypothetical protein